MIMTSEQQKYYAALHRRAMRYGGGTVAGALAWLRRCKTGSNKRAHVHQMFDSTSGETTVELQLDRVYHDLLRRQRQG